MFCIPITLYFNSFVTNSKTNNLHKKKNQITKIKYSTRGLRLPREKPSLWTSQTFSDPYQACSAAICSSVFTCLPDGTKTKMNTRHSIIATLTFKGTAGIFSLMVGTCWWAPGEKLVRSVTMQRDKKWTWRISHAQRASQFPFMSVPCERFQTREM